MPTYEYRCPEGHEFERFYRKMSDSVAELPCPECGKLATRKLSGGAGLVFKGSGFYLTDYGKNAHRKGGSGGSDSAGSGDKSEKSESKSSESKSGDSKSSDAKPSESKAESKSESKPSNASGSSGSSSSPKSDK